VGKSEGKRPLGRPRHRWEDGVRMDLREIGWGVWIGFDWLGIGIGGGLLWVRCWTFGLLRHRVSYISNAEARASILTLTSHTFLAWQTDFVYELCDFPVPDKSAVFC
jgi:hypothetical protein